MKPDQRKAGSLNRFLVRRAIQQAKNPKREVKTCIPFRHKIRWRFSLCKGKIEVRVGLFGFYLYWHCKELVPNNISVYADTTGAVFFRMPLKLTPGESVPCVRWVRQGPPEEAYE